MQVFKLFFILLKKYKGSVCLFAGIFLLVSLIISGAVATGGENTFTDTSLNIGIINQDHSGLSAEIRNYFEKTHNIYETELSESEILNELYWKRLDYVLIIPDGAEEKLVSGQPESFKLKCIKVPGTAANELFETELGMYLKKLQSLTAAGFSPEEAAKAILDTRVDNTDVHLAKSVNKNSHDRLSMFLLYVPYLFISVSIAGIGTILLVFQQKELKERMECSSTPLRERTLGMVAGILLFGLLLYLTVFAVSILLTKGSVLTDSRLPYFLLNVFVLLLLGLSLGFLVGNIAGTRNSINGLNNVIGLLLCMLGGIFVPIELMGEKIRRFSRLLPTYWYMMNNEKISAMTEATAEFRHTVFLQSALIGCYAVAVFAVTLVIINLKRKNTAS